jgi:hypothetical protein
MPVVGSKLHKILVAVAYISAKISNVSSAIEKSSNVSLNSLLIDS